MKYTVEFSHDEKNEFETFLKASEYKCVLHDVYQYLRSMNKHRDEFPEAWEEAYKKFWEICDDYDVNPVE